jgi:hypothetical protein
MSPSQAVLRHIRSNRQTRDAWERCAAHRRKIHALISAAECAAGSRLCVLGAGNCNDLDLRTLEADFAEVHLVDLDREAIEAGVERQLLCGSTLLVVHAPCDLSSGSVPCLRGPFDLVLSAGLITQMFQYVEDLGQERDATVQAVLALRRRHFRMLFDLASPHGTIILVTDVVSTATAPQLRNCAENQLSAVLAELIESRNFFTGANPAAIWKELTEDSEFVMRSHSIESSGPWLWPVTAAHEYLTWGVTVRLK